MSEKPLIVGLGGSLRERSYSRAALREVLARVETLNGRAELLDLRALDLPMFVPGLALEGYPDRHRPSITHFIEACRRAEAMIWASPTYHGTVSGAFKNALDFMEWMRTDPAPYLTGRAVGLIVVPDNGTFAAMANSVHELRAWLAPTRLIFGALDFDDNLILKNEKQVRRADRLAGELIGFARKM
jgi:FMN reductase